VRPGKLGSLDPSRVEAGGHDGSPCVPVEVTVSGQLPVQRSESVLPTSDPPLAANMLEQDELASRPEDPVRLGENGALVFDGAKDEGRNRGVEALVGKGSVCARAETTSMGTFASWSRPGSRFAMLASGSTATTLRACS
jgi:hypothetical protein